MVIPASLVIYPPELGGSSCLPCSGSRAHTCCSDMSLSSSQESSENFLQQRLHNLKEALINKKAEVEKERKVLQELKQMATNKSDNELLLSDSENVSERRRNSSFLEGLSMHVLQGDNGAMALKKLALRNGMNVTEADTYIAQVSVSAGVIMMS